MSLIIINLILLAVLLILSAYFSGSETALFSLDTHKLDIYKKSASKNKKMIASLLFHPNKLLITLLIGNITVKRPQRLKKYTKCNPQHFDFSFSMVGKSLP